MRAACLLLALTIAGCGAPASSPPSSPGTSAAQSQNPVALSTPPGLAEGDQPLICGSPLTFSAEALLGDPGAETTDHPAAEALRRLISDSPVPEADSPVPEPEQDGWLVAVLSQEDALFLLPAAPADDHTFGMAEFHLGDSGWEYVRSGGCDVKPWFEGLETARWELPTTEQPSPETQAVRVLVLEQTCPTGESPKGHIEQAAVTYLEDSVIVVLGNRTPPGPHIGCGPLTPADFTVELNEPLGDRQLYDGWIFPPEPRGDAS